MELKYIASRKRSFCWFIHSLCKNHNIPMRESPLPHIERKCLPIIALNFSYYEFFIGIHSWLVLAMIAKNRKLGFLLTLKQKSPELVRVQMPSFSFREWISTDIHTIAWASFPEWILMKNHPRSECIVFLKQPWYPPLGSLGIPRWDPRDWNPRLTVSFQVGFAEHIQDNLTGDEKEEKKIGTRSIPLFACLVLFFRSTLFTDGAKWM